MASSTTSLQILSLTSPQTLCSSKPRAPFASLSNPFSCSPLKLTSLSSTHSPIRPLLESRFTRNVSVSSELNEVDEEEEQEVAQADSFLSDNIFGASEDVVVPEPKFSPDLKVFVGNLPFSVDSKALAGLFGQAGIVEMVEVIYDKDSGRSRGFGFVTMSSAKDVEAVVRQFNGYELGGRELRVNSGPAPPKRDNFASGGGPRQSSSFNSDNRVYVGNLSWDVDNVALENLFSEQGKVMEARVVYDRESGRSRGFGFVTYGTAEEVNSAVEALDGADLDGRTIRVSPAEARQRRQF